MGWKPLLSLNTRTSDSCNNVTLKKEEENHQRNNGHSHTHKQFGNINRLRGNKGREHHLYRPRGGILTDHQRPEERIPTTDKRNYSQPNSLTIIYLGIKVTAPGTIMVRSTRKKIGWLQREGMRARP